MLAMPYKKDAINEILKVFEDAKNGELGEDCDFEDLVNHDRETDFEQIPDLDVFSILSNNKKLSDRLRKKMLEYKEDDSSSEFDEDSEEDDETEDDEVDDDIVIVRKRIDKVISKIPEIEKNFNSLGLKEEEFTEKKLGLYYILMEKILEAFEYDLLYKTEYLFETLMP